MNSDDKVLEPGLSSLLKDRLGLLDASCDKPPTSRRLQQTPSHFLKDSIGVNKHLLKIVRVGLSSFTGHFGGARDKRDMLNQN